MRQAITSSLIANAHRDAKKHPKAFTPVDFMTIREPKPPMTLKDLKNTFKVLSIMHGEK